MRHACWIWHNPLQETELQQSSHSRISHASSNWDQISPLEVFGRIYWLHITLSSANLQIWWSNSLSTIFLPRIYNRMLNILSVTRNVDLTQSVAGNMTYWLHTLVTRTSLRIWWCKSVNMMHTLSTGNSQLKNAYHCCDMNLDLT